MARKARQLAMIGKQKSDFGGRLRSTRAGRLTARPISTRHTMHLILKSSQAVGEQSFARSKHDRKIRAIIEKFAFVYGVKIVSFANAWNHLHLQIKLSNRFTYNAFVRAISGAIAMSMTGRTRWAAGRGASEKPKPFWDHRPFTRIADSFRAYLNLKDYVRMNAIEPEGYQRTHAKQMVDAEKILWGSG